MKHRPLEGESVWVIPPFAYVDHGCEKLADGSQLWAVSLPGAPGCIAQGATLSEAVHRLQDMVPRYVGFLQDQLERLSAENAALRPEKERKVYAAVTVGYDTHRVEGVFSARTAAEQFAAWIDGPPRSRESRESECGDRCIVEEWSIDVEEIGATGCFTAWTDASYNNDPEDDFCFRVEWDHRAVLGDDKASPDDPDCSVVATGATREGAIAKARALCTRLSAARAGEG